MAAINQSSDATVIYFPPIKKPANRRAFSIQLKTYSRG